MAKLYNFNRLIAKYSAQCAPITLVTASEGGYVGGKYVRGGEVETAIVGAVVPFSDGKIYQSGGALTTKDRQLYMQSPITNPLTGAKVKYKGNLYNIEQDTNYEDYADAYVYSLKWVKALSESDGGTADDEADNYQQSLSDLAEVTDD